MKPGVKDEIENAVSYFERSFLPELPQLYAHWLEVLGEPKDLTSFLQVGSWVGGDRDGNPFVTAEVMRAGDALAVARRASAYLDRHPCAGRRAFDLGAAGRGDAGAAGPGRRSRDDSSAQRADEPYRQALTGVYARLAASLSRS